MRPADIKRLEKVCNLYSKIIGLLNKVEGNLDFEDNYMSAAKLELEKQAAIKDGNSIDPHAKPITTTEMKYPKFKIGDWVVDEEDNHVYQVKRVVTNVSSGMSGYDLSDGVYFYSTKTNCHLWSIADAKDGDILVSKQDYPFIYNGKHDGESVGAYCGMTVNAEFIESQTICSWTINKGSIKPATKEQRELLFRKMEEADYIWNATTKELSQISVTKKSDKDSKLSEEDEDVIYALETILDLLIDPDAGIGLDEVRGVTNETMKSWLKSIKDRVQPQPKQEWTKENEMSWKNAIEAAVSYFGLPSETVNWLKSIKERMQ